MNVTKYLPLFLKKYRCYLKDYCSTYMIITHYSFIFIFVN